MSAVQITRTVLFLLAASLVALALVRLSGVVGNGEGGQCGPGWTHEYDGPCDAALKARQYEVVTELVLASVFALTGAIGLSARREGER